MLREGARGRLGGPPGRARNAPGHPVHRRSESPTLAQDGRIRKVFRKFGPSRQLRTRPAGRPWPCGRRMLPRNRGFRPAVRPPIGPNPKRQNRFCAPRWPSCAPGWTSCAHRWSFCAHGWPPSAPGRSTGAPGWTICAPGCPARAHGRRSRAPRWPCGVHRTPPGDPDAHRATDLGSPRSVLLDDQSTSPNTDPRRRGPVARPQSAASRYGSPCAAPAKRSRRDAPA